MRHAHVRLKIIVDRQKNLLGLLSVHDINSQEVMKRISAGRDRENMTVEGFMHSKSEIRALLYSEIKRARVQDIVNALKHSGQHHCLVVDEDNQSIRGLFSVSDISRKLNCPISIDHDSSFVSLYKVLFP